jgi:hypothetical protein
MKQYTFRSKLWIYNNLTKKSTNAGNMVGRWYFITLPKKITVELKSQYSGLKRGWGSLPVQITVGQTTWNTSIFPDSKLGSFVLPVKAGVRKKEGLEDGKMVSLVLRVRV